MSRLLVISDIHGHTEGLKLLLEAADYDSRSDRLYLLGDYVDDDIASFHTLDYVQALTREGAVALAGNKEFQGLKKAEVARRKDWCEYILSLPLHAGHDSYLFVHAGIRPGVSLEQQTILDLTEIREPFHRYPHLDRRTVVFGHTPTHRLGAERGELWQANRKLGIDTGAKHGCRLTLVDLTNSLTFSCSTAADQKYGNYRKKRIAALSSKPE
ncbi:metallophosphoesterase [Paenibacillus sepulcri]|uniref:Metallophosphoesterase n=1 Tax=Paenibacillus sepulcri TaxID=359917 RepID=A0ABS7C7L5_9BACL|nr:metallophosphoesterase [Paenibacillus sepulcri]